MAVVAIRFFCWGKVWDHYTKIFALQTLSTRVSSKEKLAYLCKKQIVMYLTLRPSLFWDVDVHTIDIKKHKASVIERIVTRGHWDEFTEMLQFYGTHTVKQVVLNARWLDKRTLSFCSAIFEISETEFRCYKLAQLNPEHWNY